MTSQLFRLSTNILEPIVDISQALGNKVIWSSVQIFSRFLGKAYTCPGVLRGGVRTLDHAPVYARPGRDAGAWTRRRGRGPAVSEWALAPRVPPGVCGGTSRRGGQGQYRAIFRHPFLITSVPEGMHNQSVCVSTVLRVRPLPLLAVRLRRDVPGFFRPGTVFCDTPASREAYGSRAAPLHQSAADPGRCIRDSGCPEGAPGSQATSFWSQTTPALSRGAAKGARGVPHHRRKARWKALGSS